MKIKCDFKLLLVVEKDLTLQVACSSKYRYPEVYTYKLKSWWYSCVNDFFSDNLFLFLTEYSIS